MINELVQLIIPTEDDPHSVSSTYFNVWNIVKISKQQLKQFGMG